MKLLDEAMGMQLCARVPHVRTQVKLALCQLHVTADKLQNIATAQEAIKVGRRWHILRVRRMCLTALPYCLRHIYIYTLHSHTGTLTDRCCQRRAPGGASRNVELPLLQRFVPCVC
jgi:hypothetical protein